MASGITAVLLGVSEATTWGWGSSRTLALIGAGLLLCAAWSSSRSAAASR
jgi:hypothetical protein